MEIFLLIVGFLPGVFVGVFVEQYILKNPKNKKLDDES